MNIETDIIPPDTESDGESEDRSVRLSASAIVPGGVMYDASVQMFEINEDAEPEQFADALLNVALSLASMRGAAYSWAVMQRFAAYDGMSR